ncbi:hypothetical protein SDC9_191013 [bioreactor metagenome]|uniref:Uncharacterized protein n=1 Tax=bioreactor metagenome TaxID=1076179 RepID=A0A645I7Q1_9ZZZZ
MRPVVRRLFAAELMHPSLLLIFLKQGALLRMAFACQLTDFRDGADRGLRRIRKILFLVLAEIMRKTVFQLVVQTVVRGGIQAFKSLRMTKHDVGLQQILEKPERTGAIRQGMEELQVNPILVIEDAE